MASDTTKDFVDARIDELDSAQDRDQTTLDNLEATKVEVVDRMTDRTTLIDALRADFPSGP